MVPSCRFPFALLLCLVLIACVSESEVNYGGYPDANHLNAKVEGFEVQTIQKGEGEWLSIATDPQGRLLVSPRKGKLLRFTVDNDGAGQPQIDTLDVGVEDCQGLLYAYNSLYMMGTGPDTIRGIHRLKDLDGKGNYGKPVLLKEFEKNGDHSGHTLAVGPDGQIYFLTGNVNKVPQGDNVDFVNQSWHEDHLMPMDIIYGKDQTPPGGYVARFDSLGKAWEFYAYGLRNPYDMAFSPNGELFTFDSDMEWDFNLPWYRPTRVNHLVSGGDYAWRAGVAKRFDYFPDVWPSVVDFGRGSPTATAFGTKAAFPAKYQRALFLGDWSYGRIYALHLDEAGASYSGEHELFITGQPLNITDMIVGHDGAMYFTTGGNGTDTGLFRVIYTGAENTRAVAFDENTEEPADQLRALRKEIEQWHFSDDPEGLQTALQYIDHEDRWIRNAVRVILERQDPKLWVKALEENKNTDGNIMLLTALIRSDSLNQYSTDIFRQLEDMDYPQMDETRRLALIRLYGLAFLRNEDLPLTRIEGAYQQFMAYFPDSSEALNKELSRLLGYLAKERGTGAEFIAKALEQLETTKDQLQFIHYLEVLRHTPDGWDAAQRLAYQHWLDYARENFSGGSLFKYFITMMEKDFHANLSGGERRQLASAETRPLREGYEGPVKPRPKMDPAQAVFASNPVTINWKMEDLQYSLELVASPRFEKERDFNRGYRMYFRGQCMNCHTMFGRGGSFGPELTMAGNSFSAEDLLKSIIQPSEAINSRFQATQFKLKDGGVAMGRLVNEEKDNYLIQIGHLPENVERVPKAEVASQQPSPVSEMPHGLINSMSREEVLDLLYFIIEVASIDRDSLVIDIFEQKQIFEKGDSSYVDIVNYGNQGKVFYTTDGSAPTKASNLYSGPFFVKESRLIRARAFTDEREGQEKSRTVHAVDRAENGMRWSLYKNMEDAEFKKPPAVPDDSGVAYNFDIKNIVQDENKFMLYFESDLQIDEAGEYTFSVFQADVVRVYIDDKLVIDATGKNRKAGREGSINLSKGRHLLFVAYYDNLGSEYLEVNYEGPGITKRALPGDKLFK